MFLLCNGGITAERGRDRNHSQRSDRLASPKAYSHLQVYNLMNDKNKIANTRALQCTSLFLMNSSVVGSHSTARMYEATRLFYKMGNLKRKNSNVNQKRRWPTVQLQQRFLCYSILKKATEMHKMCLMQGLYLMVADIKYSSHGIDSACRHCKKDWVSNT